MEDEMEYLPDHYEVERILDMKMQEGEAYCLVKWKGWNITQATWEKLDGVVHLNVFIKDYLNYKKYDLNYNGSLKTIEEVFPGMNPYLQTSLFGHYLYGDEAERIVAVKRFQNGTQSNVFIEIAWKPRSYGTVLQNSLLESKLVIERDPEFLIRFYESKVQLHPQAQIVAE